MKNLFIGFDANGRKIYLTPEDRRATSVHVIGSPGSGKSKFLEWMIREDIKNGQGLCLLDPHGFLYEDIVKWCAYHNLNHRDIILLNPSDSDYVIGFNPFRKSSEDIDVSVQVDRQIQATIRPWGSHDTDETPTLERWVRCIFHTLNEKDLNVLSAEYLINFYEAEVREYLTTDSANRLIRAEWRELASHKTPRQFREEMLSTKNRLFRLLCSQSIRRFMGLKQSGIDVAKIMDEGKILLVNLASSKNLSEENARFFGSLLVNDFFLQAKRRKRDEFGHQPKDYFLYIDEFQNFVDFDIARSLDQLRKFGLHFILSHQRFGQLGGGDADIVNAIFNGAKISAIFGGLGRDDAKRVVEERFVNQLDLREIKKAIYQTKFWPQYSRDKVHTTSHGYTFGQSSSQASSLAMGSGAQFIEGESWFGTPSLLSTTDSSGNVTGSGEMEAKTHVDAEADIPIFIPVPFEELTSETYWNKDEQIWRMSDALMAQFQRHCFIKIRNQKTQPMLVPKVKEYRLFKDTVIKYQKELYKREGALHKEEADKLLQEQREELEYLAKTQAAVEYPTKFRE